MADLSMDLLTDIDTISRISVVPAILEVICHTTGMGFAAIARVTDEKWIACSVLDKINFGIKPGGELELETTICNEIRQNGKEVIIDHVAKDEIFSGHHTPAIYGFQSYISFPIFRHDGSFFGTLCAIDPNPAALHNPGTIGSFRLFCDLISLHLNSLEQVKLVETKLSEERKTAELREQFIAILGHDLRNPLGAVSNSAQLMLRMPLDDRSRKLTHIIRDSSYRMNGLIENILDFASGHLGEGISISLNNEPMEQIMNEVIAELQIVWPARIIKVQTDFREPVNCDGRRIAQLFSNLLGNALTHGESGSSVYVNATSDNGIFTLSVSNSGEMIPAITLKHLFQPFSRGKIKPGQQGLGLGLYIASEIARAHKGTLEVTSNEEKTCFTLNLPC